MIDRHFYVYIHRRKTNGRIFYVGKGMGERLTKCDNRNIHWRRIVAKHGFTAHKVSADMPEPCALSFERALIAAIGRENLCNMTDGGDGISGYRFSEEQRKAIGDASKASWTSDRREAARARRLGVKPGNAGVSPSSETRAKISAANKGRKKPSGFSEVQSQRQKGVPRPPHVIEALRMANLGKPLTDETKRKLSEALKGEKAHWYGKEFSADHCRRISEGKKGKGGKRVIRSDGVEFWSALAAANHMRGNGFPKAAATGITCTCRGRQETAYGFGWKYA